MNILLVFLLMLAGFAAAEEPAPPAAAEPGPWIARARERRLADERAWQALLHMSDRLIRGRASRIDDPAFFKSPAGKTDPAAELEADLRFFAAWHRVPGTPPGPMLIARYAWLKAQLALGDTDLFVPAWETALAELRATSYPGAGIVFPVAYMNNPASMFGHTFLNVKVKSRNSLLARTVDYSARTREKNGLVFAFKGLTGLYRGYFSSRPYFERLREYNDMEQRDIWEYDLDLSEEEIRRMVYHLHELSGVWSSYFFFFENCSYNVLVLLEVARPELDLSSRFRLRAIPVDTVRAVADAGLVKEKHYRPALATRMAARAAGLGREEVARAVAVSEKGLVPSGNAGTPADPLREAQVLGLAADRMQYLVAKGRLTPKEYSARLVETLSRRSKLGRVEEPAPEKPPEALAGHASRRFRLGGGMRDDLGFAELAFRPSFHALSDPDRGHLRGCSIDFFNLGLRWYGEGRGAGLDRFDLVEINSLAPMNPLTSARSFKFSFGLETLRLADRKDHLVFRAALAGGPTWALGRRALLYAMLEPDAALRPGLAEGCWLGAGPSAGLVVDAGERVKVVAEGRGLRYVLGPTRTGADARCRVNLELSRGGGLLAEGRWSLRDRAACAEWSLGWNAYF